MEYSSFIFCVLRQSNLYYFLMRILSLVFECSHQLRIALLPRIIRICLKWKDIIGQCVLANPWGVFKRKSNRQLIIRQRKSFWLNFIDHCFFVEAIICHHIIHMAYACSMLVHTSERKILRLSFSQEGVRSRIHLYIQLRQHFFVIWVASYRHQLTIGGSTFAKGHHNIICIIYPTCTISALQIHWTRSHWRYRQTILNGGIRLYGCTRTHMQQTAIFYRCILIITTSCAWYFVVTTAPSARNGGQIHISLCLSTRSCTYSHIALNALIIYIFRATSNGQSNFLCAFATYLTIIQIRYQFIQLHARQANIHIPLRKDTLQFTFFAFLRPLLQCQFTIVTSANTPNQVLMMITHIVVLARYICITHVVQPLCRRLL